MIHWRAGTVIDVGRSSPGAQECSVQPDGETDTRWSALALTDLVGAPRPGDRVLLNVSALRKGLGTGGQALIVARPDALPSDPPADAPGHIMKARYTPLQTMVCALEEQESPFHEALRTDPKVVAGDLDGTPVIVAELHSALPAILAGIRAERPDTRVAYVMTDSGALPMAYSRTVAGLVEGGWLDLTVSAEQSFGGQYEAITVHSALLAARWVLDAEIIVVAQGPGNAGSSTAWGYSGLSSGEALNAVHTLRGRAIAALRVSGADPRARHRGLSHHADTALGRVVLGSADVVIADLPGDFGALVRDQAQALVAEATGNLRLIEVPSAGLREALAASPVPLGTMGRGVEIDDAPFVTAAAAGRYAAGLL